MAETITSKDLFEKESNIISSDVMFSTDIADPNDAYFGLTDPNEVGKRAEEVLGISVDLELPILTSESNYRTLTDIPKRVLPGTIAPIGVGEPDKITVAPERTKWQKFKGFFVGKRPPLAPDADRIEKLTRAFDIGISAPLRTFLMFSKGMTLNAPDLMWAAIKRVTPDDMWVDEVKNMNLEEAMDWAGGYNPSGFQKSLGDMAEFIGRLQTVAPIARQLGVIGNTPKDTGVLIKAGEMAKLFGTAAIAEQLTKGASESIDPTETEYGYEGPVAVLRDMAIGAIFSVASSGAKAIWQKVWSKLSPSETARALKLLGLKKGASADEITKASLRMALKTHPDKVKGHLKEFLKMIKARDLLRQGEAKEIVFRGQKITIRPKLLVGEKAIRVAKKAELDKLRVAADILLRHGTPSEPAQVPWELAPVRSLADILGEEVPVTKEGIDKLVKSGWDAILKAARADRPIVKKPPTEAITAPEKPVAGRKAEIAPAIKAKAEDWQKFGKRSHKKIIGRKAVTIRPVYDSANHLKGYKVEISDYKDNIETNRIQHQPVLDLKSAKGYGDSLLEGERKWQQEKEMKTRPAPIAKPEPAKVEKPKPKKKPAIPPPLAKETRDILGGVDPINQIHIALKAAKAVRPITEAAKKEAIRKRIGAAAGALRRNLQRGMPAERAIQLSTGLLKGPLTEYDQLYESIEDTLEPGAKDAAYGMIATHPDLRYFEVVNTKKSFQKLLAGSSLTPVEAAQIERVFGKAFEEQLAKVTTKSDLYDRLITYWKASLLTGLKTSGLNILSTAGHAMTETTKDIPAALIDSGISLVTGERKVAFAVKGYGTGWVEGLKRGWKYMKTGHDERDVLGKYDYKKTNFGTSKIARTIQATTDFVFHLLGAEDQPWYYGAYSRSLRSQAIAQAKTKGLKGKAKKDFINNLQKNPTDEMLIWAKEDAETAIYTNRTNLGDLGKAIQKVKGGEIVVPFARTPSAVAMQIINYSPIGIVKEIAHEAHEGKFNQRKFSHAAGRTVVGTGALYLGAQLFTAGLITLGFPKGERERKLWELEGKKPNSILIDGKWRGIEVLGPTGNLLIIGGYFQQALDSKGSPTQAMIEAMAGGAKSFTEQTFVRGVNLAVDALVDPERSFERWFTSMSGSLVPTIVADIARAQDDRARRAVGPKERIQSRIPIYRRGLPPKIDVFGQDLPRYGGNVLETMIDPTRPAKIRQDVVVDELRRLWDKNIKVSPTLLGDRAGYNILTKEENTQLWQRAGELTYKALFGLINSDKYREADKGAKADFVKGQLIDEMIRSAKTAAKLEIVIIKKAQGKTIMQLAESGLFSVEEFEMLKYFQEPEKP